jgi:prophage antirepressor-like protein
MDNKLVTFENAAFGKIRTLTIDGEPWFVAADVCKALELGNPSMTVERLDADEKGISSIDTLGGKQRMAIINEPGLYSVILCSRKPEAKAFKRWITHEVIPAIRKYGGYMTKSLLEQVLENPNLIYEFARRMLAEQQKNERLKQELDRAKPKADYYDAFIHPESCTNIRATAKELKVPEKMFTAFLIRKRYLYRAPSGSLMPYAKAADDGLFFVKDYIAVNGHQGVYTLVTPKGKALFLSMLGEIA